MVKAVFDTIIVKPESSGEKRYGSIVIPDAGKELPHIGEVISVGPGKYNIAGVFITPTIKVGDKVILPKIGPVRVEYENEEYLVTSEVNVLAIIEK